MSFGRTPTDSQLPSGLVATPAAGFICLPRPQGPHPPSLTGSTPLPTWAQHCQGCPHSAAEQRVQHEHPVWADLAPAEDLLHLERNDGAAETAKPQGLRWKGLESLLPETGGVGGLGVKGRAGKLGLGR